MRAPRRGLGFVRRAGATPPLLRKAAVDSQPKRAARCSSGWRTPLRSHAVQWCSVTPARGGVRAGYSTPTDGLVGQQRRSLMRWIHKQQRAPLEAEANLRHSDAHVQARLMREMNRFEPEAAVGRFESGRYAVNEEVVSEYLRALAKVGRLDRANIPALAHKLGAPAAEASASAGGAAAGQAAAAAGGLTLRAGGASEPLHVVMAEPGFKSQLWRMVRFCGLSFLLFSAASALIEERGMGASMGMNDKPEPVTDSDTRFSDVKGVDEATAELQEVVSFLRDPERYTRLGGKLPKGLLLVGPPGTGKTLLARAIAGEAGVPFFYSSGSEFEEMFVGVGARRVRDLFASAKKHSPCIIFIDEIDAIGGKRNPKDQHYMKMTLNQMLVEMDGFESNEGIIVIGATNLPDSLDKALVRPGRFDRNVQVPNPDVEGRRQILELYMKKIPLADDAKLEVIARGTSGFSGAELFNLVNMASLKAAFEDKVSVGMAELEYAKDKIVMGAERTSAVISEESKKLTAFHEAGHALMAMFTSGAMPVHKATIVPRGQALGLVSQLPDKDETSVSMHQLLARLDVCMGGRVAEELVFGERNVTSGASSDLSQATQIATAMVTRYGMNAKIGPVSVDINDPAVSSETKRLVEEEVQALLTASYKRTQDTLTKYSREHHMVCSNMWFAWVLFDLLCHSCRLRRHFLSMKPSPVMS